MNELNKIKRYKNNASNLKMAYVDAYTANILDGFEYSPSYYKITKNNDLNTFYDAWIIDMDAYKLELGKKKIILKPGQDLKKGEYFNWNNQRWLVITVDPQVQYYNSGIIMLCNYRLKWVHEKSMSVKAYDCIVENKKRFTTGLDESEVFIGGSGDFQVTLPADDFTLDIHRDRRFLVSITTKYPMSFKVSRIDNISNPNIVLVNLMEEGGQLSQADDKVNMIADYYLYYDANNNWIGDIPQEEPVPIGTGYEVLISGNNYLKNRQTLKYTAAIYNNGILDNTKSTIWTIDISKVTIMGQDENSITLKGILDNGMVDLKAVINGQVEESTKTIIFKPVF